MTDAERAFYEFAEAKAAGAEEPTSHLFWLNDPDELGQYHGGSLPTYNDCGDFCEDCITSAPALVPLTVCLLLDLLGVDVTGSREHVVRDGGYRCSRCDGHGTRCWSVVRECMERVWSARDGGWSWESDGLRCCDACGKELIVSLTEHGAREEYQHYREYGPPDCPHDWRCVSDAFEAANQKTRDGFMALAPSWGYVAPVEATSR